MSTYFVKQGCKVAPRATLIDNEINDETKAWGVLDKTPTMFFNNLRHSWMPRKINTTVAL